MTAEMGRKLPVGVTLPVGSILKSVNSVFEGYPLVMASLYPRFPAIFLFHT